MTTFQIPREKAGNSAKPAANTTPRSDRHTRWRDLALLALLCAFVTVPAFWSGELAKGHDGRLHLSWQKAFAAFFPFEDLYPRWLAQLDEGFGSPVFFIYPPLSHMLAAMLGVLSPVPLGSQTRLAVATAIGLWIGGAGVHAWVRGHGANRGALAAAIVYVAAPYHLFVDVYLRVAFAEAMAFAPIPWLFWAIDHVRRKPAGGALCLAFSVAALLLTHLPSALVMLPAAGLYALIVHRRAGDRAALLPCGAGAVAGTLLAGGYLSTALTQSAFINFEALYGQWSLSWRWLIGFFAWPDPRTQRMILIVLPSQALLFLAAALVAWRQRTAQSDIYGFCLAGGLAALFMMTSLSEPIWRLETPLNRIQFPWRLLGPQALFTAAMLGIAFNRARHRRALTAGLLAALLGLNGGLLAYQDIGLRAPGAPESRWEREDAWEYRLGDIEALAKEFPDGSRVRLLSGSGKVEVETWDPRRIALRLEVAGAATVAVRQFNYTGWTVAIDGEQQAAMPDARSGDIVRFRVADPGAHRVTLHLAPTTAERAGWICSAFGLILLVLTGIWLRTRRRAPAEDAGSGLPPASL